MNHLDMGQMTLEKTKELLNNKYQHENLWNKDIREENILLVRLKSTIYCDE